jgi:hypothetical protein
MMFETARLGVKNKTPRDCGVFEAALRLCEWEGVFGARTVWSQPFLRANRYPLLPVKWVKDDNTK